MSRPHELQPCRVGMSLWKAGWPVDLKDGVKPKAYIITIPLEVSSCGTQLISTADWVMFRALSLLAACRNPIAKSHWPGSGPPGKTCFTGVVVCIGQHRRSSSCSPSHPFSHVVELLYIKHLFESTKYWLPVYNNVYFLDNTMKLKLSLTLASTIRQTTLELLSQLRM